ncbi:leucyl aminopeptidase [Paeniglutamicibacter sp. NPDC091659]|uniref:leucyl aminopeptidase n=1 Tax=Paeniglutamicibacter sp. NPDC091659 TaxID=3364389 RepID=UPI0038032E91
MAESIDTVLTVIANGQKEPPSDALVIGVAQSTDGPVLLANPLDAEYATVLGDSLEALGATGTVDQVHRLPGLPETGHNLLVLAGVGKVAAGASVTQEGLRRASGSAIRQLAGLESVTLALPTASPADVAAVAEGAALGAYSYTGYRTDNKGFKAPVANVRIHAGIDPGEARLLLERAGVVGKAVNDTRTLVNRPPSCLYPESFVEAAKELAAGLPVTITVWDAKRLEEDGFGGILGVGRGSGHQPRLVKVEYSPATARKSVALVGKGITFDSGGMCIKPALGMTEMKSDMAGAAVVLNTVLAAAALGLPVKTTAWLCIAENMPSGSAQRPGDVLTIHGGKTVEVIDTDAEGRLVLADGIAAASVEKPDAIIDVATLTGAQMIALGTRTAAVMGSDILTAALKSAADSAGEPIWPMPLPEELRATLDSHVADIASCAGNHGDMLTAAVFLQEFVGKNAEGEQIPWAHLDIAGPAFNSGTAYGYTPVQGTGSTVRTLVVYLESLVMDSAKSSPAAPEEKTNR